MSEIDHIYKTRVESRLKATKDIEEFKTVAHTLVQEVGFSDFSYERVNGESYFELMLTTNPKDIVSVYEDNEISSHDVILESLVYDTKPVFQKEIFEYLFSAPYKSRRQETHKKLQSIMDQHNLFDGYSIPLHIAEGDQVKDVVSLSVYCKGLSSDNFRNKVEKNSAILSFLSQRFFTFGCKRFGKRADTAAPLPSECAKLLTKREIDILQKYLEFGFKIDSVAKTICRSETTVRKHTANIRQKLGVNTTYDAVMLSVENGLIKKLG